MTGYDDVVAAKKSAEHFISLRTKDRGVSLALNALTAVQNYLHDEPTRERTEDMLRTEDRLFEQLRKKGYLL